MARNADIKTCSWCGKRYDWHRRGADLLYCSTRCKTQAEAGKRKNTTSRSRPLSKSGKKWGWIILILFVAIIVLNDKCSDKEKAQEGTSVPVKETTVIPVQETKSKQIEIKQTEALETTATFEEVSDEEKQTLKTLLQEWSTAHNDSTINDFNSLFDDIVQFYGTRLSKKSCIENKETLLQKHPDFQQEIYGGIDVEQTADNEYRCNFTKRVTVNQKTTDYPSYLIFKKTSNQWKIIVESDLVTDKNLAKKKK